MMKVMIRNSNQDLRIEIDQLLMMSLLMRKNHLFPIKKKEKELKKLAINISI